MSDETRQRMSTKEYLKQGCCRNLNDHHQEVLLPDENNLDVDKPEKNLELLEHCGWNCCKVIATVERNAFMTLKAEDQYQAMQKYWKTLSLISVLFAGFSLSSWIRPLNQSSSVGFFAGATVLCGVTTALLCVCMKTFLFSLPKHCAPNFMKEFTSFLPLPAVGINLTIINFVCFFLEAGKIVYDTNVLVVFRMLGGFVMLLFIFLFIRLLNGSMSIAVKCRDRDQETFGRKKESA